MQSAKQAAKCPFTITLFRDLYYHSGWEDEGEEVPVVSLIFSKAFGAVSHKILTGKLRKCGLDMSTVGKNTQWDEHTDQELHELRGLWPVAQSLFTDLQQAVFPRGQHWDHSHSTYSSMTWMKGWSMPSASLLMIQDREEWLTHQKALLPVSEIWTGWRVGQRGT